MKQSSIKEIALQRIWRLFELAEKEFRKRPDRSKRYVKIARDISERLRVKIPAELKKKYCKKCGAFLVKGKNAEWKKNGRLLRIKCKECGKEFAKQA